LWHHGGTRALGVRHQYRWCVFYHPGGLHDAWKTGRSGLRPEPGEEAFHLGINLIYYAYTRYLAATRRDRAAADLPASGAATAGLPASGAAAVQASEDIAALKEQSVLKALPIKEAGGRRFARRDTVWVDLAWNGQAQARAIKFGGEAFFQLLRADPRLQEVFALGVEVLVVLDSGQALLGRRNKMRRPVPVYHIAELVAYALGADIEKLDGARHKIKAPLLAVSE
jgi:hypothetical protein